VGEAVNFHATERRQAMTRSIPRIAQPNKQSVFLRNELAIRRLFARDRFVGVSTHNDKTVVRYSTRAFTKMKLPLFTRK
jgi:hypothetical protein